MSKAVDQLELPAQDTALEVCKGVEQSLPPGPDAEVLHPAILASGRVDFPEEESADAGIQAHIHESHQPSNTQTSSLPPSITNFSQELLTPWSCKGMKIFVDICSGADKPFIRRSLHWDFLH